MQPFIFGLYCRLDTEFFDAALVLPVPNIKQMLTFVLSGIAFNKTNMSTHFITIISKINKFYKLYHQDVAHVL